MFQDERDKRWVSKESGAPHVVTEDDEVGGIVYLTWLQSTTDCDKET